MEYIYVSKVSVNIGNQKISVDYLYNKNFAFLDLLEYLAYLFPKFEICQCFKFRFKQNTNKYKNQYIDIPNDSLIQDFSKYLKDLYLDDSKKYCLEHKSKNYFKYSKTKLISSFEDSISKLEYINKKRKNEINLLEKDKLIYTNEINDLKQKKDIKEFKNFYEEKKNILKLEINKLQNEIKQSKDKRILEKSINGILDKINLLSANEFNLKENNNLIEVDKISNKIKDNQKFMKIKPKEFYDIIFHIDSIKDVNKGWKIEFNEKTKENYESFKNKKMIKIGLIGNSNKGKSFLLSKLCKINLPSGTNIRTEGLSIKYPMLEHFKDREIVILDSKGFETPVLNLDNQNYMVDNNIKEFVEKSREKLITEIFLQNYIINNSDIPIVVVGILTYSEQKLLMRIKTEIKTSKINIPLFIIHNLKEFTSVQQVQDYINDFLLKSATFNLEEGYNIQTKTKTGTYYYEPNKDQKIFHLIYANEDSEAGKYYNQFTLDFLENNFFNYTNLKSFDVIETIKDGFFELSKDIIEETDEIIFKEMFDDSNPEIIKLKDEKEIIFKRIETDEFGFYNLKPNGFDPPYNFYIEEDKAIAKVEVPGNFTIRSDIEYDREWDIIKLRGQKNRDKEPYYEKDGLYNTRKYGNFSLKILFRVENRILSNEMPKIESKKGVCILKYNLSKKQNRVDYNYYEDEEI